MELRMLVSGLKRRLLGTKGLAPFADEDYLRINYARQSHLASLGLDLDGKTVLEVGSGPGDHTAFFLKRGCTVTAIDARAECLDALRRKHPGVATRQVDLEHSDGLESLGRFQVVYCYGLLYHLSNPRQGLEACARVCDGLLLVETCVSPGPGSHVNPTREPAYATQAASGTGCRPTRLWVFEQLASFFPHVYNTRTQPCHAQFPLDWSKAPPSGLMRAVFVASREALALPQLHAGLVDVHDPFPVP